MRAISQPHRRSMTTYVLAGVAAAAIIGLVVVVLLATRGGGSQPTPTPTPSSTPSLPLLAAAGSPSGSAIDGIQCQTNEQVAYHIHAHIAVYVGGQQRSVPEGVGIEPPRQEVSTGEGPYVVSGACYYWLHTHTDDGIIHIESPTRKLYTLGNFFDIWGHPLSTSQVGPDSGTLIIYVSGKKYTGDPRVITLTAHELIQIDVNTDVAPQPFTFPVGL